MSEAGDFGVAQTRGVALECVGAAKDRFEEFIVIRICFQSDESFLHLGKMLLTLGHKRLQDRFEVEFHNRFTGV